jgi:hypothetical protein
MLIHAALLAMAMTSSLPHAAATGDADPMLNFERTVIDLGAVSDEQPIRQPFKFIYTGMRTTKLSFDHCHFCPEPESDRPRYESGQSGFVILELATMGKYGDIQTTADVSIPGEADSHVSLQLKASVHPRIMIRPDALTLRDVSRTAGAEATLVFIGRKPDFEVQSVSTESPWVEAVLQPVRELEDLGDKCRAYDVKVRLKPGLPLGDFKAVVRAKSNDAVRPDVGSTIDAEVVGDLIPEPDHVTVGWMTPGQRFSTAFTLSTRSGRPLFYGSVKLAVEPGRGMGPIALDVEPGEQIGTLRVKVVGSAPPFATQRIEADVIVTEEDDQGRTTDEMRVPIRMGVRQQRIVR